MPKIDPAMDIVGLVLSAVREARPNDEFCRSIEHQYFERGSLSRKQLEGLHGKALKIPGISPARLATLEAIIKKKPVKDRTPVSKTVADKEEDTESLSKIEEILALFPTHKAVLLLKSDLQKNGLLNPAQKADLLRFHKLLMKNRPS